MFLNQKTFSVSIGTNIIFGLNSVKTNLTEQIKNLNKTKVFIVTDNGLVKSGIIDNIITILSSSEINSVVFSEVEPNPHAATVMRGAEIYINESCDMILAVGGGSAMDFGKAVGVAVTHPGHILDYRRGMKVVSNELPVFFAIPTTVGTGSEVTSVSVVTDHEVGRKYVVASPLLTPKIAFIDPLLTTSLPRHVVAATGADALVHAIESYTSVKSNPINDGLGIQAIKMLKEFLPASFAHPDNIEARAQVHLASTLAGMSFGMAGVGLVHSCSHPMSAIYHVPHGLANAILLPYVIDYNLISNYKKFADIARIFDQSLYFENDIKAASKLVALLKQFTSSIDIPEDFRYLNIEFTDEMIERLANDAMDDVGTIPNNPRKVHKEDVLKIYKKVLPLAN